MKIEGLRPPLLGDSLGARRETLLEIVARTLRTNGNAEWVCSGRGTAAEKQAVRMWVKAMLKASGLRFPLDGVEVVGVD